MMGANSKIEWCDHTFNPWIGCSKVSLACDHCYAEHLMDHRLGRVNWGGDRSRTAPTYWLQPLKWNRAAERAGNMATVFCLSLGDIWDNEVDQSWRRDLFSLMDQTPHLIWLLLSKRIGNAVKMCSKSMADRTLLPPNAALGATMVNQDEWGRDAEKLEYARDSLEAMFSFASIEPMLGPMNIRRHTPDWVICGGESGNDARPMHPAWPRALRDQCAEIGAAFHFKQWGEWATEEDDGGLPSGHGYHRVGKKAAGRLLDGIEHNGFPVTV